jgi:hypothetical protein
MNRKKTNWLSYAYVVALALFVASCALNIAASEYSSRLSDSASGLIGVAPAHPDMVLRSFCRGLKVEAPRVSVEEMTETKAWSTLQENVSAYAQRLDLMEQQIHGTEQQFRRFSRWTTWLPPGFLVAAGVLERLDRNKRDRDGEEGVLADAP